MAGKVKVRVIRRFKNKYSKSLHHVGDLLTISEKRLEEINSAGYGIFVEVVEAEEGDMDGDVREGEAISEDNVG